MVDILEASGANRPKAPLAATPTSTQSEAQIAAPGVEYGQALRGVGRAFDAFSEKLDAASIPAAQAAGLAAVGRDEKGLPTFEPMLFAISGADRAYNAAGMQGAMAGHNINSQRGLLGIAQQHSNDPAGFEAASKAFIKEQGGGDKELRPLIQAEAEKVAQQHLVSISNRKFTQDTDNARIAVATQIEDNQNQLFALARRGGMGTPEVVEALAKNRTLYEELGKNPAYGYPPAKVQSEVERIQSQAFGEAIIGEVDRTYDKRGSAAAQKYLTDEILNNPKLNLSNTQRSTLYAQGMARRQFLDGETKAKVDAHRSVVGTIVTGLQSKVQIPDAQIDDAIGTAQKLGDAESVLKLNAARSIAGLRRGTGLTDEQEVKLFAGGTENLGVQQRVYQRFVGGGLSPVMAFGLLGNIGLESSFNTSARNPGDGRDGSDSVGLAQWNGPRAAALKQFATAKGKDWRDVEVQADFVVHELNTTEGKARAALSSASTPEEAGRAAIGYFRPAGFSWANPDGAHNSGKRIEHARVMAGTLGGGGQPQREFTPDQLRANPFLGSIWIQAQVTDQKENIATASRLADAISNGIDKGMMPNPQSFGALMQLAEQYPDQLGSTRDKLIAKAQGYDDAQIALGQPTTAGATLVQQASTLAQGAPILVQQQAEAMKAAYDRGVKALKDQPWQEAVRRDWTKVDPGPLNFISAQTLSASLTARAGIASSIRSRTGDMQQSALSPDDVSQISGIWNYGTPDQKAGILGAIGALPDDLIEPTLRSIAKDPETGPLAFVAGLSREAPESALAIVRGEQALRLNAKLAPSKDDWIRTVEAGLPMSITAPERGAVRQNIAIAVRSTYAGLSARDGDESGDLKQPRLDEAVKIVTGGLVEHNGGKLIPPARGMTQDQFERVLWSLKDEDFAGTSSKSGISVTAADVRRNFVLRGTADGRYALQARNSPGEWLYQKPVAGRDIDNTSGGYAGEQRFVLDLKGREPVESAPAWGGRNLWRGVR